MGTSLALSLSTSGAFEKLCSPPGNSRTVLKLDREAERDGQGLGQELVGRTKGCRMQDAGRQVQSRRAGRGLSNSAGEHRDRASDQI